MKIALSQSPFSQSTTHSGDNFDLIGWDQDSKDWPKPGRDQAVHQLRKAFAPHLSGDQHLGLSLKHDVDEYNDAVYSFAAPSMLNIFPRIWDPLNQSDGRGDREINPLGQYTDKHNNLLTVLAVANPEVYYQTFEPADKPSKNDLGIGYGIVRVNTRDRQYSFEAWPADINPLDAQARPYENWPVTFEQEDNDGRVPEGFFTTAYCSRCRACCTSIPRTQ
ncbi:MAG: alkaline phosphatase D [Granulosicoccus sp.]|jgi:alkaline phosphatase D